MSLAARLETLKDQKPAARGVPAVLASLDEPTASLLRELLLDESVSILSIYNALRAEDIKTTRESLARYRNENKQP